MLGVAVSDDELAQYEQTVPNEQESHMDQMVKQLV